MTVSDPKADQYARAAEDWAEQQYANTSAWFTHRAGLVVSLGPSLQPGEEVLELACGDAALGDVLLSHGLRYRGVDITPEMIDSAKVRLGAQADVEVGDLSGVRAPGARRGNRTLQSAVLRSRSPGVLSPRRELHGAEARVRLQPAAVRGRRDRRRPEGGGARPRGAAAVLRPHDVQTASSAPRAGADARAFRPACSARSSIPVHVHRGCVALRVTHVHRIGGIGGSERHLLTLLPALAAKGVDVRFVGLDMPGADPFYDELDVPFERVSRPWQLRGALKRAQRGSRPHAPRARRRLRRGLDAHADRLDEAQPRPVPRRALALRRARAGAASTADHRHQRGRPPIQRRGGRTTRGEDRGHPLRARRAARALGREPGAADPR